MWILASGTALADTKYEIKDTEFVAPYVIAYETAKGTLKPESGEAITYVKGYLAAKSYISTLRIESTPTTWVARSPISC